MTCNRLYFLGIGGIGMSALARYYRRHGVEVWGYDRTRSELCVRLEQEGCHITYTDSPDNIRALGFDAVVYTPAIHPDNAIYQHFVEAGTPIKKRAQVLGDITRTARGLCVSGTHGKTTTSTMLAHLLRQSTVDCSAFLGGISVNYDDNLLLAKNQSDLVVVEADEFDRSFHQLSPYMAVVTATDADHLDIYGTHEAYLEAFAVFVAKIRPGGTLLVKEGVRLDRRVQPTVHVLTYAVYEAGQTPTADYYAHNIRTGNGALTFDLVGPDLVLRDLTLGVPVLVNVENAVAAMTIAHLNGVADSELRAGIASFRGVHRRFEIRHSGPDFIHIDDYAHHPDELSRSIDSVHRLYSDRSILVIFQPHLYSRTRDFYRDFARSLSRAERVLLLDIYPAREAPIPGVTSRLIYDLVTAPQKWITDKAHLRDALRTIRFDVVLTVGAGDIGDIDIARLMQTE